MPSNHTILELEAYIKLQKSLQDIFDSHPHASFTDVLSGLSPADRKTLDTFVANRVKWHFFSKRVAMDNVNRYLRRGAIMSATNLVMGLVISAFTLGTPLIMLGTGIAISFIYTQSEYQFRVRKRAKIVQQYTGNSPQPKKSLISCLTFFRYHNHNQSQQPEMTAGTTPKTCAKSNA